MNFEGYSQENYFLGLKIFIILCEQFSDDIFGLATFTMLQVENG